MLLTAQQRKDYEEYYPGSARRMHNLPPGIESDRRLGDKRGIKRLAFREKFSITEDQIALLQIGSGFKVKGIDRSLKAVASLPPELREKVESMRNPVVQICKAGYGLKRAVFAYEAGRDERILSTGAERVRGTRCVFKYRTKEGYEAFSGFFIDDAFLIGHETAVTEFLEKLENKRADGTPLFTFKEPPALTEKCHCLGIEGRAEDLHVDGQLIPERWRR